MGIARERERERKRERGGERERLKCFICMAVDISQLRSVDDEERLLCSLVSTYRNLAKIGSYVAKLLIGS